MKKKNDIKKENSVVIKEERDLTYDWLRLIATIFVVIGHSVYLSHTTTFGGVSYSLPNNISGFYFSSIMELWKWLSEWVYSFHMPLFFMLSGAVLALKPVDKLEKIIKSKTKRLIFPYFIYGWLFMLPVKFLADFYNHDSFLLAMKGFLKGVDSGHLWFLPALFWLIILFVILEKILKKLKVDNPYILLIITAGIQLYYNYIPVEILGLMNGTKYIFWFAFGYCFEYERKKNKPWNIKKTTLAFIVVLIIEFLNKKYNILTPFFLIICGSFFTYLMADLCNRIFKNFGKTKIWNVLIRNLFFVYLLHDPLEYVALKIFMNSSIMSNGLGCLLYFSSRTIIIFVICVALGELIRILKKGIIYILNDSNNATEINNA